MHRCTHTSINMCRYGTSYFYINVCIVIFRFMEVVLKGCLDMLMLCACCLFICTLKHARTHTHAQRECVFVCDLSMT